MSREINEKPSIEVDLTKPINHEDVKSKVTGACFGKEWDMGSRECPLCADNEVCGIIMGGAVKQKVKTVEDAHAMFLDATDFLNLGKDGNKILEHIESGVTTTQQLIAKVKEIAKTADDYAAIEWVKRYKAKGTITIKQGIVWTV